MKVFFDEECLLHDPPHEIICGKLEPYYESPKRLLQIRQALEKNEIFQVENADRSIDTKEHALHVHSADYLEYLESAFRLWVEDGGDPKDPFFPEAFANPKFAPHLVTARPPRSLIGKAGYYCFDLSCPITADTYISVLASATVALTAAKELLRSGESVFALSRPPGHHAGSSISGGYCYFNNVAIVAKYLQREAGDSALRAKIAILDIDYHHGNGTQEIFYSDSSVAYVSLHEELDYPYFTGSREERGDGVGEGFNHNFPLPLGTDGNTYCSELREGAKAIDKFNPAHLIVSLGVDTFESDPIAGFKLTTASYAEVGCIIRGISKPTLFVLEGGYDIDNIGKNVRTLLEGFVTGASGA